MMAPSGALPYACAQCGKRSSGMPYLSLKFLRLARALLTARSSSTEDDRGRERLRRAFLTSMASLLARFGSIAALLVTVPMALSHLGPERFGMWMIISSFAALMAFADFGIGNGVLNLVANASGADDNQEMRAVTASGFVSLAFVGSVLAAGMLVSYAFVDWAEVFKVSSPLARAEAGPSILVFMLCMAVGLPASLASKVQFGLQSGYATNLWVGIGGIAALITVFLAIRFNASVPIMTLALFGSQQLAAVCNYIFFFYRERRDLAPRPSLASKKHVRAVLSLGTSFFFLQLIGVIAFRVDTVLVAQFFGTAQAGVYAVYERLYSPIVMLVSVAATPLWPAYGEALKRQDFAWIRRILRVSMLVTLVGTGAIALALALASDTVVTLWLGHPLAAPTALIVGFAVWRTLDACGSTSSMFLNGVGAVRIQAVLATLMCVAGFTLKLLYARDLGIAWIIWFTILTYGLLYAVPLMFIIPRLLRTMMNRPASTL